ncbi:NAD-dependent epimerase/dehydratase family protein [Dermatobacter hominis]|uniref:NAD-dependent epimerase/dehydratase family protein n=1 Tax=Dermatobacter hominis TaxID=2884263 RepID=UPI001D11E70B|nr:NAD-dependent epimerase/dehydratase family protein [Dermatobacter hominis]UDY37515.1 NAD-dependent epimerase/dehydratase family protein [Dermatobacter hominis]
MKIVVTGASGNLGSAIVPHLVAAGHEVVGVARRPVDDHGDVRWRSVDISVDPLDDVLRGADAVVHLAWLVRPSHRPVTLWRTNVVGTRRVLEAAVRHDVGTFVHASSIGAYRAGSKEHPVDESWPTDGVPTSSYSWQKAYVERMLDAVEAVGPMRCVRVRPTLVLQRSAGSEARRLFLGRAVPAPVIPVGPTVALLRRSPLVFQVVHADDVASAIVRILGTGARGAFNLASDPPLGSPSALSGPTARAAELAVRALWSARVVPADPGWVDLLAAVPLLDPRRARDELGWRPTHAPEDVVREALEGVRSGAGAPTPPLRPWGAPDPTTAPGGLEATGDHTSLPPERSSGGSSSAR